MTDADIIEPAPGLGRTAVELALTPNDLSDDVKTDVRQVHDRAIKVKCATPRRKAAATR